MLKLKKIDTIARQIKVRLPTDNPAVFNEGTLDVRFKIASKDEVVANAEKEQTDLEFFDQVVVSVDGLGDENGNAITGDAALKECKSGPWSVYLVNAILQDYWEQYGDARAKNSKTSRGR